LSLCTDWADGCAMHVVAQPTPWLRNFIVLPWHKMLLCAIEKNGFTTLQLVADRVVRMRGRINVRAPRWYSLDPSHFNMSLPSLMGILHNASWRKVVVYRDPFERFLSAFASKCLPATIDGWRHCGQLFRIYPPQRPTLEVVAERLAGVGHRDAHWAPQVQFCGATVRTHFADYTHQIALGNLTNGILAAFSGAVPNATLAAIRKILPQTIAVSSAASRRHSNTTARPARISPASLPCGTPSRVAQRCSADDSWFDCGCEACRRGRPRACASNARLSKCACPMEEVGLSLLRELSVEARKRVHALVTTFYREDYVTLPVLGGGRAFALALEQR
jgi:hypothetical protein